jgi:hypothetical protein
VPAPLFAQTASELEAAQSLAWAKRFAEAEARYRAIVARHPQSRAARLGLARVVLWQLRYGEAAALFDELLREDAKDADAIEGRASAAYWSGDLRTAARLFRRIPERDLAAQSLREIAAVAAPSQRIEAFALHDDQPLDAARTEAIATFFSDPQTRWSAALGGYRLESERRGTRSGPYVRIDNETTLGRFVVGGSLGLFEYPDGTRRPIGGASVRYKQFTLRVDHREELAAATSLPTHASSTTATLRWYRETARLIAAAEANERRYFDDNRGHALVAYAVAPLFQRGDWTIWGGASTAFRDTDESRFNVTATSATLDPSRTFFHYAYRGEYDPYWTPVDLREARAVFAVERRFGSARVKLQADGGVARDRGRAFGPDAGLGPFPANVQPFTFERDYRPWRAGLATDFRVAPQLRLEFGIDHSTTVDYRSTSIHAAVVRRR